MTKDKLKAIGALLYIGAEFLCLLSIFLMAAFALIAFA